MSSQPPAEWGRWRLDDKCHPGQVQLSACARVTGLPGGLFTDLACAIGTDLIGSWQNTHVSSLAMR